MVGAGGVGGISAAFMTKAGYDVTLVCKYKELAELINNKGLHIFGHCDDQRVVIPSVATVQELQGTFDIVFIATKATVLRETALEVMPLLTSGSKVVSMQNGIVEEELAKIAGADRTVGCIVSFGATMHEPGILEMTSDGNMTVGYLNREPDPSLEQIAEILSSVVDTSVTDELLSHLYAKLIINACTSTLGAISGLDLGDLLKRKRARDLFIAIAREALEVAKAMNLTVKPYAGRIKWYRLAYSPEFYIHLFIRLFGLKYKKLRSTNLQSLERGKPTEVDYLNGYIAGKGGDLGVATPVNSILTRMVHEIEKGKRPISPINLDDDSLDSLL